MKLNRKAFTLVELLAVIVVLAIVAVIAMQSITTIINNNRMDSFVSSAITVAESSDLVCLQVGKNPTSASFQEYVDKYADSGIEVTYNSSSKKVIIKATGDQYTAASSKWSGYTLKSSATKLGLSKSAGSGMSVEFTYNCDN